MDQDSSDWVLPLWLSLLLIGVSFGAVFTVYIKRKREQRFLLSITSKFVVSVRMCFPPSLGALTRLRYFVIKQYHYFPLKAKMACHPARCLLPVGSWKDTFTRLTLKALKTTIAKFSNTVDPDETAHNESSHQDLVFLPCSLRFFNIIQFIFEDFPNFSDVILSSVFFFFFFFFLFFGALQVNAVRCQSICIFLLFPILFLSARVWY